MKISAFRIGIQLTSMILLCLTPLPSPATAQQSEVVPARDEIDKQYTWDLTALFESDELWEEAFGRVEKDIEKYAEYEGKIGTSAISLLECLKLNDDIGIRMDKLSSYAYRKRDQDLGQSAYQAMSQRIQSLQMKRSSAAAFIEPEILSIDGKELKNFLKEEKDLDLYEHYFDDIRRVRDHILPKEQEKLLSLTSDVAGGAYATFAMMTNADFEWGTIRDENDREVQMSQGRYFLYMTSPDRRVRHDAYMALYVPFDKFLNTLTSLFSTKMKTDMFYTRARKYQSSLESALDGPNIPVEVYKNLLKSVNDNLAPLQRWAAVKKRILGVEELHPYDTYAPLFPEVEKKYTYEEAQAIVREALQPLGDRVQSVLDRAFEERWIDVYENTGKRGGAYSSGVYGVHPYILLNFDGTLGSVSTLAHELGHTLHSYLSNEAQPYIYAGYASFNAEVASTMMEALLYDYLLKNAETDDERLSLLQDYIQRFGSTFYRQTRFAEFDLAVHEMVEHDEPLTKEVLTTLFGDIYQKYWGPDMVVDEVERISWARIPHFYYNYYVYTYATSFAASQLIARRIKDEGQAAVDDYLKYLQSGSSDYPVELLKIAGVDMSSPAPFSATASRMNDLLDKMEEIISRNR